MRDEAGDCTRYAYAALQLVSRRYNRATMWDQLEAQLTRELEAPGSGGLLSKSKRFSS
jgi:hypothetical protein